MTFNTVHHLGCENILFSFNVTNSPVSAVRGLPYAGECEKNDGMTDNSAAECTVRHQRRLFVLLNEWQPRNIRILNISSYQLSLDNTNQSPLSSTHKRCC